MSKVRKAGCAAVIGLGVAYIAWVNLPTARHSAEIEKLVQERTKELTLLQTTHANDRDNNIFWDPTFREMWCLSTELKSKGGPIEPGAVDKAFKDFSGNDPVMYGQERDAKGFAESRNGRGLNEADVANARKAFESYLPKLKATLAKAVFISPMGHFDSTAASPNFIGLRRVTQTLAFESALLLQEGKPDEAVELPLLGLHLSKAVSENPGNLICMMLSAAMDGICFDSLHAALVDASALKPETLKLAGEVLQKEILPQDGMASAAEIELVFVHNTLLLGPVNLAAVEPPEIAGGPFGSLGAVFLKASGLWSREARMTEDEFYEHIKGSSDKTARVNDVDNSSLIWDDVLGRRSLLGSTILPSTGRATVVYRLTRSKLQALRVIVALRQYQLKNGKYPASLDDLKEVGLTAIPANEVSAKPLEYKLDNGKPQLILPVDPEIAASAALGPVRPGVRYRFQDNAYYLMP